MRAMVPAMYLLGPARPAARALATLSAALTLAVGCTPPVAVHRLGPREAQLALTANVLTTGEPSEFSRIVLRRHDLLDTFEEEPNAALAALRTIAIARDAPEDELFALAELSYEYAEDCAGQPYYLAAALYAYAVLFPGGDAPKLDLLDARTRIVADIYNRAIAEAFESRDERDMVLAGGTYALPFGTLDVAFDPEQLAFGDARFDDFMRIADYEIRGFTNRYRKSGIGAPVAPHLKAPKGSLLRRYMPPVLRVPSTVLLTFEKPRDQVSRDLLNAQLKFFAFSADTTAVIDGRALPLESEPTATLAAGLADTRFWTLELSRFLGRTLNMGRKSELVALEPGRGRIPVVFVHGTNSSSARWANMVNDLINDPEIHRHYSFWFFGYMSSQPIALSARELRLAITDAMHLFSAGGPASGCGEAMVVIGHSQGGLLTKMTAIDSGDRFWRKISDKPFEEVSIPPKTKNLLREALFVEPLPYVKRVIFVATPHRGSFLAGPQIVRRLVERLVTLPVDILQTSAAIASSVAGYRAAEPTASLERVPTSIDNMSPGNAFIQALGEIPVAPGITANSIVAVKEGYDPYEEGNDGVVEYESAHIDGVESEFVVRSPHSTQSNPHTIEEVRRILVKHAEAFPCTPLPLQANEPPSPTAGGN